MKRARFLEKKLQPATVSRYRSSIHHWTTFLLTLGVVDEYLVELPYYERVVVLIEFVMYLETVTCSKADMERVMTALRNEFRLVVQPVDIFGDESLQMAKGACHKVSGRSLNLARERVRRLPVTLDFITQGRILMWSGMQCMDSKMVYLGMALAFNFMFRASEYIMDGKSGQHTLLCDDVVFFAQDNLVKLTVQGLRQRPLVHVTSILFIIRSSKSDQVGQGRYLFLSNRSSLEIELTNDVVWWALHSGANHSDPFLSRVLLGRLKKLTRREMTDGLRAVASHLRFDGTMVFAFQLHSLRIGGATSRMAAGADRETTKRVGGWARDSSCDRIYYLNSALDEGTLSLTRDNTMRLLTATEVHQLVPPSLLSQPSDA